MSKSSPKPKLFFYPARVKRFCAAVLFALVVAIPIVAHEDRTNTSVLKKGDFPAFYSAGVILKNHLEPFLYNPQVQANLQMVLWPNLQPAWVKYFFPPLLTQFYLPFAYPPFVALLFKPLASLPPLLSQTLVSLVMILLLGLSARLTCRVIPQLKSSRLAVFTFFFAYFPLVLSALAGQNTALSLFIYCAILAFHQSPSAKERWSGLMLGGWLFKPHFGLIAAALLLFSALPVWIFGFLLVSGLYFVMGAAVMGWSWPVIWLQATQVFMATESSANRHQLISIPGVMDSLGKKVGGQADFGLHILGLVLAVLIFAMVARRFWNVRQLDAAKRAEYLMNQIFLVGPAVVLLSPHTMFYDSALFLPALARYCRPRSDRQVALTFLGMLAANLFTLHREVYAIQPIFFLCLIFFFVIYQKSGKLTG